jgi:flagellar biosynthesis protein FlhF
MKIKRFIAEDIRSALRKVSAALGPDAVILSNNRVEGGIEIVAAIDYDDSLIHSSETPSLIKHENIKIDNNIEKSATALSKQQLDKKNRNEALDDLRFARNIPAQKPYVPGHSAKRRKIIPQSAPLPIAAATAVKEDKTQYLWTEEPAFIEMKSELKSLRGLLVNQLSDLSWGREVQYHPLRARLLQRLTSLGLNSALARDIASQINEEKDFEHNWRMALGELAQRIPVGENDILENGGVIALVGATGVGKTTTIAKLAARYTLKHGPHKVALITTDNYRVAAHEQLRSYARIMGLPIRVAGDIENLRKAFDSLQDKELILIDTAGMSQRDMLLNKQFEMLRAEGLPPIKTYLTLATNCQRGVLSETGAKFKDMKIAGCILTKVDETTSMGGALMTAIDNDLPISYICDGQQVPENLHIARSLSIVSRSVSIMQHMASASKNDNAAPSMAGVMVANGHG